MLHISTHTHTHTYPAVDDVLLAVVLLPVDDGLADVRPRREDAQRAPLAVVHAGHGLAGVHVDQRHVSAGVRHPALDLLVVGQDVVAEGHHRRDEGDVWI